MRKLIVTQFLSLDGVMEDPGGSEKTRHGGWSFKFNDPEGMKFKLEETLEADALLLGRVTYEGFAEAWPGRTDEAGFADKMNSMAKHVVSTTLTEATWENSSIISGDVPGAVRELKEGEGGPILVAGSRTLVQTLRAHDLVDQYNLMVHPILLGEGKRLFEDADEAQTLTLTRSQVLDSGSLILVYEPRRS